MRSRFSRKARETAWSTALAELGSWGMRRLAGKLARFVILEGTRLGVNRRGVALCLEVPRLGSSQRSVVSFQCGEAANGNGRPVNHSGCEKRKFRGRTAIRSSKRRRAEARNSRFLHG